MWEDPIVAEVHRAREKLVAESNFDIDAFFAGVRQRQASLNNRLILQKQRTEPTAEAGGGRPSVSGACIIRGGPGSLAPRLRVGLVGHSH